MHGTLLQSVLILILVNLAVASPAPKSGANDAVIFTIRVEAPLSDVLKAVQDVTQDQIIHGTYSYEKERILYGARSADAAPAFETWKGPGKVFYKIAERVLSPRYFKDTGDIGTITIRYVVEEAGADASTLKIEAVFIDARNVRHPSLGNVESSEYTAIQQHLRTIQQARGGIQVANTNSAPTEPPVLGVGSAGPSAIQHSSKAMPAASSTAQPNSDSQPLAVQHSSEPSLAVSAPNPQDLPKRLEALRHQVELRVKDSGASLKSAPFRSSTTISSIPGQTEVLVVVLTPYWYGVETEDGRHGWIHHSEVEPLP